MKRLEELNMGPIAAANAGGIERTFIRDIIEGKKRSVRSDKLEGLARALHLDAAALARNEMVRVDGDKWGQLTDERPPPKRAATTTVAARIGELFASLLQSDEDTQIRAIKVLEEIVPRRQRSGVTKTKAHS
ncbi:hypothetical protein SAZ10_00740 [Mesorhizobium sp. BAC0120]|uniref:hypothetical protein n=1 Tax=Mesorhizobium sp. BAC0120 TaxID=3090670 RepID=UPI00298CEF58|nr:hypothetical protein [Mesorhizobium sp. BAC0120]MDW6020283.1 hypothetical protein [Mesorhizobium sp. BAC0120]